MVGLRNNKCMLNTSTIYHENLSSLLDSESTKENIFVIYVNTNTNTN